MRVIAMILFCLSLVPASLRSQVNMLPNVLGDGHPDLIALQLRQEAALAFTRYQLPTTEDGWQRYRQKLKTQITTATGTINQPALPLLLKENGQTDGEGFTIKHIRFQTRPGVFATASLYVPKGKGPFPAVVITHGHWPDGRRAELFQSVAQVLVRSGYVCLNMDAWGAGERCTAQDEQEYHGSNLGASLLNVGETLMGMQLTDNMRAVDLLSSLPDVNRTRIGATGASGGGNQAMWLAAMDERIQAVVPVVSVGTFESYILNSNCVCELLPTGLTFTEEAGILALIAPRALKLINALQDTNPSFFPAQMLRSYRRAAPVFGMLSAKEKISYQLVDSKHGYDQEMREIMLGWFNLHLKGIGTGAPQPEPPIHIFAAPMLATYAAGQREKAVLSTADFCQLQGDALQTAFLGLETIDAVTKRNDLKRLLHADDSRITKVHQYDTAAGWERLALETSDGHLIPVLYRRPAGNGRSYHILIHNEGKNAVPTQRISQLLDEGQGVVLADLWGTGEQASAEAIKIDGSLPPMHTLARSAMWLGKTVMGIWADELSLLTQLCRGHFGADTLQVDAYREAGLAALYFGALHPGMKTISVYQSPYSYLFDTREGIDFYNMGVHVPAILRWGDVSLLAALSEANVRFEDTRTLSGRRPTADELAAAVQHVDDVLKKTGNTQQITFTE